MTRSTLSILGCLVVASSLDGTLFRGPSLQAAPPARDARLEREIRALLGRYGVRADDVSLTVHAGPGERVVDLASDRSMKPASNMKLLTTLVGLDRLGPNYEYETSLSTTASIQDGSVQGDVTIFGTGDPNISSRSSSGQTSAGEPLRLFRTWARRLLASGVSRIEGNLIVDDTFFDDERFLAGWKRAQEGRPYSAEVSSLNLQDNCVEIHVRPTSPGHAARVEIIPTSSFLNARGAPSTTAGGATKILIRRTTGTNDLSVTGKIRTRDTSWFDRVAIHDPAMHFGHALADVLRAEGVRIDGRVVRKERPSKEGVVPASSDASGEARPEPAVSKEGSGDASVPAEEPGAPQRPDGRLIVRHTSRLSLDLPIINKESQNLHAEVLLKTLGARFGGEGSVAGGGRAIRAFLREKGLSDAGLEISDGSGLSHGNRLTTGLLTTLLDRARSESYFPVFLASLAVSGEDGTLERRFVRGRHASLRGRVRAKTGYIFGVSALSGYVRRGETRWCFSMLFRRLPGGNASIKRLQEHVVAAIDAAMERRESGR